jgi:soluble cytochrome b562
MLPFLRKQQEGAASLPVEHEMRESDDGEFNELHGAMDELMSAMKSGDTKGAAEAFKSAFEICESYPHEEYEEEEGQ